MARVVIGNLDIESITSSQLKGYGKTPFSADDSEAAFHDSTGAGVDVGGSGFTYDASGKPTAGTVTSVGFFTDYHDVAGTTTLSATGLSVDAADVYAYIHKGDITGLKEAMFAGDDQITGSARDNVIAGYDGNDTLVGMGGADTLTGGDGDDTLRGGDSNASRSDPSVVDGADHLDGGRGNDILRGQDGDDVLLGGKGDDNIRGDRGNDQIDGGSGSDFANYRFDDIGLTKGVTFDASVVGTADVVKLKDGQGGKDTLTSIEKVILLGSQYADTLTGSVGDDQITGNGDDTLAGGKGADTIFSYSGHTHVDGGSGNDGIELFDFNYFGGALDGGKWTVDGGSGSDTLEVSFDDLDTAITATAKDDGSVKVSTADGLYSVKATSIATFQAEGGTANDVLTGGKGDDTLLGRGGDDVLKGGDGDDELAGGRGNDTIDGGSGHDLYSITVQDLFSQNSLDISGVVIAKGDTLQITDIFGFTDTVSNIEGLKLVGGYLDDQLTTGNGDDVVDGSYGSDTIHAGKGDDLILATTYGTTFPYDPNLGYQNRYSDGNDTYDGGKGTDTVSYADVPYSISVDMAKGTVTGEQTGTDHLTSIEHIIGGAADDVMVANDTGMTFEGGAGDDLLQGGKGADVLVGGDGDDTFKWTKTSQSTGADVDTVKDFAKGDVIDLSKIDANTAASGNQAFRLVDAFVKNSGDEDRGEIVVHYDKGHDRTVLTMDVNNDQKADMTIYLAGDHHDLGKHDFLF